MSCSGWNKYPRLLAAVFLGGCISVRPPSPLSPPAEQWFDTAEGVRQYRAAITTSGAEFTGILALKYMAGEREWRGSLINEFGIGAFDFVISEKRCRLLNMVAFLDKWYIRRTVEDDLYFLFRRFPRGKTGQRKRKVSVDPSLSRIRLLNERRNIEYSFQVLP